MLCFRIDSGRNFLALLHFFLLFSSSRLVFINVWKLTKFFSPSFLFQAMKTFNTSWPPYTVSLQPFVSPSRPSYAFSRPRICSASRFHWSMNFAPPIQPNLTSTFSRVSGSWLNGPFVIFLLEIFNTSVLVFQQALEICSIENWYQF